ncbi:PHD finger protein 10 isoform X2 [Microcebus murinus]|uniref:PHD finger protein 10 isoform X2 n=1 Tax=Microcebus murinus TaxID=30608 RepID=UPI003F6C06EF
MAAAAGPGVALSPRPCDSDPASPGAQSPKDDNEDNSNDGTQPPKRRRMGSGDSSRSCETSSQDLGLTNAALNIGVRSSCFQFFWVYTWEWNSWIICFSYYPAENLIEYKWPPDETGEYYMLQEQVSEYLGVTSFKRKYPERRDLSHKEKLYLRELNVITETQCTLGLTALRSDEVIDLMIKEYPAKHAEYSVILQEKERQRITDHYKEYSQMQQQNTQKVEASKVPEYIKKAAKKAAEFNSNLNRERMEERRAYFDLQTHVIQVPRGKYKVLPTERTKVSSYPVALIPGQFQEYYKRYSPDELRYLPLNTALYEPPLDPELPALDSDGDSDDVEDGRGDEKRKSKGTSDSSSGNVSEGESPPDSQEDSFQGRQKSKDKAATPRKDGSKRSVLSKSVPGYKPKVIPNAICGICLKGKESNKKGKAESLIHCSQCDNSGHPSCLDMTMELVSMIKTYPWQCMECKTCIICGQPHHEEEMMFCDVCDRGYHTFCVGLGAIPSGRWICDCCQRAPPTPRKVGRRGKNSKEG